MALLVERMESEVEVAFRFDERSGIDSQILIHARRLIVRSLLARRPSNGMHQIASTVNYEVMFMKMMKVKSCSELSELMSGARDGNLSQTKHSIITPTSDYRTRKLQEMFELYDEDGSRHHLGQHSSWQHDHCPKSKCCSMGVLLVCGLVSDHSRCCPAVPSIPGRCDVW
eukprot:scaffold586_cov112-Skeletonema_dohrnii-CCMP3373.AAC.22